MSRADHSRSGVSWQLKISKYVFEWNAIATGMEVMDERMGGLHDIARVQCMG